jgi:mRNA interferase HigB
MRPCASRNGLLSDSGSGARGRGPLEAWHQEVVHADWASPSELKAQFRSASVLQGSRAVFNIAGTQYRLVVKINYVYRIVYIRFVGTHQEYDQIDDTPSEGAQNHEYFSCQNQTGS